MTARTVFIDGWLTLVLLICSGCSTPVPANHADQAASPPLIIDVRTTGEFDAGHIEDAVHIPFDEIASRIADVADEKDREILLYCRSGGRAGIALQTLIDLGYTRAVNAGGYEELKRTLLSDAVGGE